MDEVTRERRIKKAAELLVDRFGMDAPKQADRRMLELEMRHKMKSAKLWRRIGDAVREELRPTKVD